MARMTDEEADFLDEYYTKNLPIPGPNGTGFFSKMRKTACSITVDDLSTKWLITKANASNKTPADIIEEMVREKMAVAV